MLEDLSVSQDDLYRAIKHLHRDLPNLRRLTLARCHLQCLPSIGTLYPFLTVLSLEEADLTSARYLAASPYPSSAAADIWTRLIDEDDARAEERNRTKRNRSTGWFASHPAPLARSEYLARAAAQEADAGDFGAERYAAIMDAHLLTFFDDQLQRNDFAASKYILDQMAGNEWRSIHHLMQGELFRKRGLPRDLVTAEESYRTAIAAGATQPEAWRGLGLTLMRARNHEQGAAALATYLELAPDAPDAPMMQMMIKGS